MKLFDSKIDRTAFLAATGIAIVSHFAEDFCIPKNASRNTAMYISMGIAALTVGITWLVTGQIKENAGYVPGPRGSLIAPTN